MKKYFFIFLLLFFSCSRVKNCPELNFNSITNLTVTTDGKLYTGRCQVNIDGSKKSIQQYVNGVDYGKWTFYYPNGKIETMGRFKDGKRIGKWKYFYESGKLKQVSRYSNQGERYGKWVEYDENGNVLNSVIYK